MAILAVRVTPRAGRSALVGVRDAVLLVKLAAAPVEGAANDALVELLSRELHVPERDIQIVSGERSRSKRVEIAGLSAEVLQAQIGRAIEGS